MYTAAGRKQWWSNHNSPHRLYNAVHKNLFMEYRKNCEYLAQACLYDPRLEQGTWVWRISWSHKLINSLSRCDSHKPWGASVDSPNEITPLISPQMSQVPEALQVLPVVHLIQQSVNERPYSTTMVETRPSFTRIRSAVQASQQEGECNKDRLCRQIRLGHWTFHPLLVQRSVMLTSYPQMAWKV